MCMIEWQGSTTNGFPILTPAEIGPRKISGLLMMEMAGGEGVLLHNM